MTKEERQLFLFLENVMVSGAETVYLSKEDADLIFMPNFYWAFNPEKHLHYTGRKHIGVYRKTLLVYLDDDIHE